MQRVCFLLHVRPEKIEEYRQRHQTVWPSMLDALRNAGWNNYSLFLEPGGLLVGYFETEDLAVAQDKMRASSANAQWQREMAQYFEGPVHEPGEPTPSGGLTPLEEIFYLA